MTIQMPMLGWHKNCRDNNHVLCVPPNPKVRPDCECPCHGFLGNFAPQDEFGSLDTFSSCCRARVISVNEETTYPTSKSLYSWWKCSKCEKKCSQEQMMYFTSESTLPNWNGHDASL